MFNCFLGGANQEESNKRHKKFKIHFQRRIINYFLERIRSAFQWQILIMLLFPIFSQ